MWQHRQREAQYIAHGKFITKDFFQSSTYPSMLHLFPIPKNTSRLSWGISKSLNVHTSKLISWVSMIINTSITLRWPACLACWFKLECLFANHTFHILKTFWDKDKTVVQGTKACCRPSEHSTWKNEHHQMGIWYTLQEWKGVLDNCAWLLNVSVVSIGRSRTSVRKRGKYNFHRY